MTTGKKITGIFMLAIVAIIAVFDIWVMNAYGGEATISGMTLDATRSNPTVAVLIGFSIGFLCGHLFWPQHLKNKNKE